MNMPVSDRTIREVFIQKMNAWKKGIALWLNHKTSSLGSSMWLLILICFLGISTAYNILILFENIIKENSSSNSFEKGIKTKYSPMIKIKKSSLDSVNFIYKKYMNIKKNKDYEKEN